MSTSPTLLVAAVAVAYLMASICRECDSAVIVDDRTTAGRRSSVMDFGDPFTRSALLSSPIAQNRAFLQNSALYSAMPFGGFAPGPGNIGNFGLGGPRFQFNSRFANFPLGFGRQAKSDPDEESILAAEPLPDSLAAAESSQPASDDNKEAVEKETASPTSPSNTTVINSSSQPTKSSGNKLDDPPADEKDPQTAQDQSVVPSGPIQQFLSPEAIQELLLISELEEALRNGFMPSQGGSNDVGSGGDPDFELLPAHIPTVVTQARIPVVPVGTVMSTGIPGTDGSGGVPHPSFGWFPAQAAGAGLQSRSAINGINALLPTINIDPTTGGFEIGTQAQFPQPTAMSAFAILTDGATTPTVVGRLYFYQPTSTSSTIVLVSASGLTSNAPFTVQLYTNPDVSGSCANIGATYTSGGLGLIGTVTSTVSVTAGAQTVGPYGGVLRANQAVMTLFGPNTAIGHSVALVDNAGAIAACGAIVYTPNTT